MQTGGVHGLRPGKPPEDWLDGGEGNEGGQGFGKVLEVLGETPVPADQEKVRSTTQRRGRTTKPFRSSLRLTISMRSRGAFATAPTTAMRCSHQRPRSIRAKGSTVVPGRAPIRRRRDPGSRQSAQSPASAVPRYRPARGSCGLSPSCRRVNPPGRLYRPLFRRFHRLALENGGRRAGLAAHPLTQRHIQLGQIASQVRSR
jgi:hypothetical protein